MREALLDWSGIGLGGSTQEDGADGRRGVLASHDDVTPTRRDSDVARYKVTVRDALIFLVGAAGMWGTQVATQSKTQSSIDNLATRIEGYQSEQHSTNTEFQRQVDDARRQAALALVNDAQTAKELAELKGFLAGSGVKVKK